MFYIIFINLINSKLFLACNLHLQMYEDGKYMFKFFKMVLTILLLISYNTFSQEDRPSTIDNSKFMSQSVPATMKSGQDYALVVTFENNGTTIWMPESYRLNIIEGPGTQSAITWGVSNMVITEPISPGKTVTFEIKATRSFNRRYILFPV